MRAHAGRRIVDEHHRTIADARHEEGVRPEVTRPLHRIAARNASRVDSPRTPLFLLSPHHQVLSAESESRGSGLRCIAQNVPGVAQVAELAVVGDDARAATRDHDPPDTRPRRGRGEHGAGAGGTPLDEQRAACVPEDPRRAEDAGLCVHDRPSRAERSVAVHDLPSILPTHQETLAVARDACARRTLTQRERRRIEDAARGGDAKRPRSCVGPHDETHSLGARHTRIVRARREHATRRWRGVGVELVEVQCRGPTSHEQVPASGRGDGAVGPRHREVAPARTAIARQTKHASARERGPRRNEAVGTGRDGEIVHVPCHPQVVGGLTGSPIDLERGRASSRCVGVLVEPHHDPAARAERRAGALHPQRRARQGLRNLPLRSERGIEQRRVLRT